MPTILAPSFSLFFARFSLSSPPPPPGRAVLVLPRLGALRHRTRIESKTIEGGEVNVRKTRFPLSCDISLAPSRPLSLALPPRLAPSFSLAVSFPRRLSSSILSLLGLPTKVPLSPATRDPRRTNTGFLNAEGREGERRAMEGPSQ